MTRRPALDAQPVGCGASAKFASKVSRGGGSKDRPQSRRGFGWLHLAAGLLFFFSQASVGSRRRVHAAWACSARAATQHSAQQNTTQYRPRCVRTRPADLKAGQRQPGGGDRAGSDRVRHEASAADAGVEENASVPGGAPRRAKQSTGSFSDARMWRRRVLLGDAIADHFLGPASCGPVSPPLQRPLSRQALQGAVCLVPSPLARPSACSTSAAVCSRRCAVLVAILRVHLGRSLLWAGDLS
ncbi:hypothetical protein BDU57DRAFT_242770 [Ampelomyces quisqualis]|uniref:Transmembrane protein n=1 Tax=Ampelomyces quisqualis TaxID=50730 RepID=A0A6A5QPH0_AMPQU|nr:hypothetical protein BDU57DRAFT_242770 [Ampelomyces quisqualis]